MGLLTPEPAATQQLRTGQVGYVFTGMKSTRSARLGDTWHLLKQPVDPLPGFKPVKSMVFAGAPLSQPHPDLSMLHPASFNMMSSSVQNTCSMQIEQLEEHVAGSFPRQVCRVKLGVRTERVQMHIRFGHCAGLYPVSNADFDALASAVERLTLNDASVAVKRENSTALGAGFRCG